MAPETLRQSLGSAASARPLLAGWGLRTPEVGFRTLTQLAAALPPDALAELCPPLGRGLPRCADADMALNNLERFLANPDGARQFPALLENRARCLEVLVQLLAASHFFSDLLSQNPAYLDILRLP